MPIFFRVGGRDKIHFQQGADSHGAWRHPPPPPPWKAQGGGKWPAAPPAFESVSTFNLYESFFPVVNLHFYEKSSFCLHLGSLIDISSLVSTSVECRDLIMPISVLSLYLPWAEGRRGGFLKNTFDKINDYMNIKYWILNLYYGKFILIKNV